jgi:hypothetical protein
MLKGRALLGLRETETDMIGRIPKRAAKLAVAILAATALMAVAAGAASAATVFNNFESTASSKQAVSSTSTRFRAPDPARKPLQQEQTSPAH